MSDKISDNVISQLSELVRSRTGLYFPMEKRVDLKRGIKAAARELAELGESVDKHLSPREARRLKSGGLTRCQLEVVQQVALGKTNQEIAQELVLSPRTVDMHVGNILSRLDCRTRAEAVRRAGELGLLE